MSLTVHQIPDDRDWKKAYLTAMTTRDDGHFYENMATALELAGMRERELAASVVKKSPASLEFHCMMEELEVISEALYLLKAYYEAQQGGMDGVWRESKLTPACALQGAPRDAIANHSTQEPVRGLYVGLNRRM
jgi:hypothetical protein